MDVPFVLYEEEVSYCCKLRAVMVGEVTMEISEGLNISLWIFDKPFMKLHMFYGYRLRNSVLKLE